MLESIRILMFVRKDVLIVLLQICSQSLVCQKRINCNTKYVGITIEAASVLLCTISLNELDGFYTFLEALKFFHTCWVKLTSRTPFAASFILQVRVGFDTHRLFRKPRPIV